MLKLERFTDVLRPIATLYILVSIDYFSVGLNLFKPTGKYTEDIYKELISAVSKLGGYIFIAVGIMSNLFYGLFTSINHGVSTGIVYESMMYSQKISQLCIDSLIGRSKTGIISPDAIKSQIPNVVFNIYICMFISIALFAVLSFVPYYLKAGNNLKFLPSHVIYVVMSYIAIDFLRIAGRITVDDISFIKNIYRVAGLFLGILLYIVDIQYPNMKFLIPGSSLAATLVFNIVWRFVIEYTTDDLLEKGYLKFNDISIFSDISSVRNEFKDAKVSFRCIQSCIPTIISMALTNLIYININLSSYCTCTKTNADYNTEWLVQGIINMITAVFGYPSYLIGCISISYYNTGGINSIYTSMGGISYVLVFLTTKYLSHYLPTLVEMMILYYLGIVFINSYFYSLRSVISNMDFIIIVSGLIVSFYDILTGILFTLYISTIIVLKNYVSFEKMAKYNVLNSSVENKNTECLKETIEKSMSTDERKIETRIIYVDYILCFFNAYRLEKELQSCKDNQYVILDLTECYYIDMNMNYYIYEAVERFKFYKIIGSPINFYTELIPKATIKQEKSFPEENIDFTG